MNGQVIVVALAIALLGGCQSVGAPSTDAVALRQAEVNGARLAYVEEGQGTTVLFVHGAAGDWRTWDGLRAPVAARFRFVSLSRRCHFPNLCNDADSRYGIEEDVADVAAFIRAMNVGKVHLVGNSYSGRLVGYVALRHPELVRSVVLGEPTLAAPASAEGKAAIAAWSRDLGLSRAAALAGEDRRAAVLLANAVLGDPEGFGKWSPVRQQRWLDNEKTIKPLFTSRAPAPVTCAQLGTLRVPALVVRGERTRDSYRHGHDALLQCLPPGTKSFVVPGATHPWPGDNPESAALGIIAFLSEHDR